MFKFTKQCADMALAPLGIGCCRYRV